MKNIELKSLISEELLTEVKEGTIVWDTIEAMASGKKPKYEYNGPETKSGSKEYDDQIVRHTQKLIDVPKAKFLVAFREAYKGQKMPGLVESKLWKNTGSWGIMDIKQALAWAKKHVATAKRYYNTSVKFKELW